MPQVFRSLLHRCIDLAAVGKRRLERRPYAHGTLQGCTLMHDIPPAKAAGP